MADEIDPGQPFFRVNILRWREIFRMIETSSSVSRHTLAGVSTLCGSRPGKQSFFIVPLARGDLCETPARGNVESENRLLRIGNRARRSEVGPCHAFGAALDAIVATFGTLAEENER